MKIVLSAVVVLVIMIGAQSAYAETAYQSGYKHGVSDSNCTDQSRCHDYIGTPGHGFSHHTAQFINGYISGWCSVALSHASDAGVTGKDVNFSCSKGLGFSDIA